MNKQMMQYVGAGLCAGLVLGLIVKPEKADSPEQLAQQAAQTAAAEADQKARLEAENQLKQTAEELAAATEELDAQQESLRRYTWLMTQWTENGFGAAVADVEPDSFNPGKGVAEFFGWTDAQVAEVSRIAKNTSEAVMDWEAAQAVYVDTEEDKLTYELPAAPEQFKAGYLEAVANVLPEADYALLATKLAEPFLDIESSRRVSLYIGQPPADSMPGSSLPSEKEWMVVEVQHMDPQTEQFVS
ncbi:hypothetical protein, partial [Pontiella sp.]|uniref:hypothetical protein n=1 Tax=Pontiella sp. TaxID=2837462 RepID=UPI0035650BF9